MQYQRAQSEILRSFTFASSPREPRDDPQKSSLSACRGRMEPRSVRRKSSSLFSKQTRPSTAQSVQEDLPPPLPSQTALLEQLRATVQKRLTTWGYLRRVHESRAHWMNTYLFSKDELDYALARGSIGGVPLRTQRLTILGLSLSSLLDISNPADFLKGLASLMSEWDSFDGETRPKSAKNRMRPMKSRRSGAFSSELEESFLHTPNIPFEFDYLQVLCTLCDILVELYTKILLLLGGRPNTPQPSGLGLQNGAGLPETRVNVTPTMCEHLQKVDHKLKKLLTPMNKELETLAREAIRRELSDLQGGDGQAWEPEE